ncbi:hypothetical protein RRG08_017265 [Elysia crispata]|uniref:Uncharacterized protein n=1 Tax=Elysia crispata TaxID=231223 RepID=A0AAE0XRY7_9GAST|nr:hypothetical protein RRG08_017265 [Elysia crispata]
MVRGSHWYFSSNPNITPKSPESKNFKRGGHATKSTEKPGLWSAAAGYDHRRSDCFSHAIGWLVCVWHENCGTDHCPAVAWGKLVDAGRGQSEDSLQLSIITRRIWTGPEVSSPWGRGSGQSLPVRDATQSSPNRPAWHAD